MRPLKLTIQAFGPYLEKHTLDFGPGPEEAPLLIYGPGGSGKTFLINALFYALFGLTGLENNKKSLAGLRNNKAGLETPTEVTLNFQAGNQHYRVKRHLELEACGDHTNHPYCLVTLETLDNEEYIGLTENEVNFLIEKIIGAESRDYISLMLPSFNNVNPMISIEQGVSKAFLQRIFQADYLENIWSEILKQSNIYIKDISIENLSFMIPQAGSSDFQDDYYTIALTDNLDSVTITPQSLTKGVMAIVLTSLHLGIINTLKKNTGSNRTTCLFLDRFLDLLDQPSLKKFASGIRMHDNNRIRLILTSSHLQHQPQNFRNSAHQYKLGISACYQKSVSGTNTHTRMVIT